MSPAVAGLIGAVTPVLVAVIAWFGAKAIRAAQASKLIAETDRTEAETDRTDAETRRTNAESARIEAESWQMLNGGLSARVTALEQENADLRLRLVDQDSRSEKAIAELRARLSDAEDRADKAEDQARQCRIDLDNFRRQYDLNAPRGGTHE